MKNSVCNIYLAGNFSLVSKPEVIYTLFRIRDFYGRRFLISGRIKSADHRLTYVNLIITVLSKIDQLV